METDKSKAFTKNQSLRRSERMRTGINNAGAAFSKACAIVTYVPGYVSGTRIGRAFTSDERRIDSS
jgi:hypothetical protein